MLIKQKILVNKQEDYREIKCDNLYLSPDMKFLSGVTSADNFLYDEHDGNGLDNLLIDFQNNGNYVEFKIDKVEHAIRQGYIIWNKIYDIYEDNGLYYFVHDSGRYYFSENVNGKLTFGTKEINASEKTIEFPTSCWVDNNIINILDEEFFVDFGAFEVPLSEENRYKFLLEENAYIDIFNTRKKLYHYQPYEKKEVIKFYVTVKEDEKVNIDNIESLSKRFYFNYEITQNDCATIGDDCKTEEDSIKNRNYIQCFLDENHKYTTEDGKVFSQVKSGGNWGYGVKMDGSSDNTIYPLFYEWQIDNTGKFIQVNLSNINYQIGYGTIIKVKSRRKYNTRCAVYSDDNGKYITYCGNKYYVEGSIYKVQYQNKEYELYEDEENWGVTYTGESSDVFDGYDKYAHAFITSELNPSLFRLTKWADGAKAVHYPYYGNVEKNIVNYSVKKYEYLTINGTRYELEDLYFGFNDESDTQVVYVDEIEEFSLEVIEKRSGNSLICRIIGDGDGIASSLNINLSKYQFYLEKNCFGNQIVSISTIREMGFNQATDFLTIYANNSFIPINLPIANLVSSNLQQADTVTRDFAEKEVNKKINRIVDMEKDIYYPYKQIGWDEFGNAITQSVKNIKFYLHFRDRAYGKELVDDEWALSDYNEWNITEHYDREEFTGNTFNYFQPSDLLRFLNFTDNDVYYQKSKIAKSFLRLSFFDSPNAQNQSLLATSTIFVNEHDLYLKYINNTDHDVYYISADEESGFTYNFKEDRKIKGKRFISVNTENIVDLYNKNMTFDEDKRLDMTLTVHNMNETAESAEGYYIHMFKEYSTKYRPRKIYMKVEFSHAGVGKTLAFFSPMKFSPNGDASLMEWSQICEEFCDISGETSGATEYSYQYKVDKNNRGEWGNKGVALKELYNYMYIPINVIYDEEKKNYIYYLDKGMNGSGDYENDTTLRFNLYELKIKDES